MEYQNKALEIYKAKFGENYPNIAGCYCAIGNVYFSLEDYDKALEYQNKALEIYKAKFGENNPNIAGCYVSIGLVYLGFGDYKTALEYFNKALEIYKAKLGESHPATLQTLEIIDEIKKELEESQGKTE